MSTNNYKPHIHVLVEDDANDQIANGFLLNLDINERAIQVLPIIGGWEKVVDEFKSVHVREMKFYRERRIVLIIDFDNNAERLTYVKNQIPDELIDRVFILGVFSKPEKLRTNLNKSFEKIGMSLSQDCSDDTRKIWGHALLKHNETELDRMVRLIKPFLFNKI